ncbi:hypothetical protein BDZ89DRAFT_1058790 [Hymenopellis radicata]|nr:hypothetical protein BDZ89DRAFT_1058790 [Hymenopellis radicata]
MSLVPNDSESPKGNRPSAEPDVPPPAYEEIDSSPVAGPSGSQPPTERQYPQTVFPPTPYSPYTASLPTQYSQTASPPIPSLQTSFPPTPTSSTGTPGLNYISIFHHLNDTYEDFCIDPCFNVPLNQRPPLQSGETEVSRKNLNIGTTCGVINCRITVVGDDPTTPPAKKVRCTLQVKNKVGASNISLHASDSPHRHAIFLRVFSRAGSMDIHLPRSFIGVISLTGVGPLTFSNGILPVIHSLSNSFTGRRYFVGDMSTSPWNEGSEHNWIGDECVLEATFGPVYIGYNDESKEVGNGTNLGRPELTLGGLQPFGLGMRGSGGGGTLVGRFRSEVSFR